jgi:hypothetical protein
MGNKDARRREKKKPKQEKPKPEAFRQAAVRIVRPTVAQDSPAEKKE